MSRIRASSWFLAFLLALALHLAIYAWIVIGVPGLWPEAEILVEEPRRGGGTFGASGEHGEVVSRLLVALGPAARPETLPTPRPTPRPTPPDQVPAVVDEPPTPETPAAAKPSPESEESVTTIEPLATALAKVPLETTAQEDPAELAAAKPEPQEAEAPLAETPERTPPTPRRKPKTPPAPQVELLEERLPVQGPEEQEPEEQEPEEQEPEAPPQTAQSGDTQVFELVQAASEGRVGTAGVESEGRVPELNYKDRVILWLKRFGGYPRDAYRFRQEGVVLLHFVIDRSGRIVVYNIRKSSGYHLLDLAVKKMMERASPVPPIPADIALAKMEFTVPVRFIRD